MTDQRRTWWNPFSRRRRTTEGDTAAVRSGGDVSAEQRRALESSLEELRTLLRTERGRLRPDTWQCASGMVERTAELLPQWATVTEGRASEALRVEDVVRRHLPRRIEAFLEIPDSQKPAAAAELLDQLTQLERVHGQAMRRLHAVSRIRLESLRELGRQE